MKREILGLALAGGVSRRLGRDKAMISFHDGLTQIDYTLKILNAFCSKIAISSRKEQQSSRSLVVDTNFIPDAEGVQGPMAGVIAGLRVSSGWPVLAVACDMPLVDASVVFRLLGQRNPLKRATCYQASDGKPEPMCTIYETCALKELEASARSGEFSLRRFLEGPMIERIACKDPQMLASVNTLDDLESIQKKLSQ